MVSLYNANLKPLTPGTYTHPYQHATKLFLADNYKLSPKQSFLYYVVINVNNNLGNELLSQVVGLLSQQIFGNGISSQTVLEQYEVGLLAKQVDLPKFKMATRTLNAYNRKNIIQTNINYDPITITFHDDMADTVTKFWNDYYTYYYRDSDYTKAYYTSPHKYQPRLTDGWGYTPRNASTVPFLTSIQIFSLHQKRFTEYELINPMITDWRHGQHDSSQSTGVMENQMSVVFETVKYKTGYINPLDVSGFATIHYDNFQSPISTSTTNIYDDNGIVGVLANGTKDLARPDGQGSGANIFNSLLNVKNLAKNLKNVNFSQLAKTSIASIGVNAINSAVNAAIGNPFTVPTASLGSGLVYSNSNILTNPYSNPGLYNGASISAASIGQSIAAGVITVGANVVNNYVNGVVTDVFNSGSAQLYQVQQNNGGSILVNQYGVPVTNQRSAVTYDTFGNPIATTQILTTQSGTYNPNSVNDNLEVKTQLVQPDGQVLTQSRYIDGTVITKDANNQVVDIIPGTNFTGQAQPAAVPINTSVAVSQGQPYNPASVRYYTDPRTGMTYTIGGTGAQIVNTISGTTGLVAGGIVGQQVYGGLTKVLGNNVFGQAISAGVSGAVGLATGRLVNNTLQPILNNFSGTIGQGIDNITGGISNFIGRITGSGGFNAAAPGQNVVNQDIFADGSAIISYKDGSVYVRDIDGKYTQSQPPTATNWPSNLFGSSTAANPTFGSGSSTNIEPQATVWTDGSGNPIITESGQYVFSGGRTDFADPFQDPSSSFYTPSEQSAPTLDWTSGWGQDY